MIICGHPQGRVVGGGDTHRTFKEPMGEFAIIGESFIFRWMVALFRSHGP